MNNSKRFEKGKTKKLKTAILHFFKCQTTFDEIPKHNIVFKCKLCDGDFKSPLHHVRNLNKHLKNQHMSDQAFKTW